MKTQNKIFRLSSALPLLLLLPGCGVGLCAGATNSGGCLIASELTPRLVISGLEGLTIRKNDCYPVTLSAVDAAGQPMTEVNASVTISASSGVVLYSSLQGCQTYDSAFEKSVFALTPAAPSLFFYFRSDTQGSVSLSASTSADKGLAPATQPISVQYTAFDGAKGPNASVRANAIAPDGRIYIGGDFQTYDELAVRYVARLSSDGSLDTSFAPTGTGLNNQVYALAVQSDGKVVLGGVVTSYNGTSTPRVARLNSDGSLDSSFAQTGTGLNFSAYSLAIQADGKVVVGGNFWTYNGTSRPYVARLHSDGSLDTSFAPTGAGLSDQVRALAIQADGKVVVGGGFTSYNGTSRGRVARLHPDGSLDTTFAPTGTGLSSQVLALAIQTDGKVVVGGNFATYNGTSMPYLARLHSDGSLDSSFAPTGTGLNNLVSALAIQPDGKVVLGGPVTSYNGTSTPRVARLNSDGSLDTSFAPTGTGLNDQVFALAVQSDDKVVLGGGFTSYNGTSLSRVARLGLSGSLDASFALAAAGLNNEVYDIAIQTDGRVMVGGPFTSYSGASRPYVVKLNSDGSLDSSFAPVGTGLNNYVDALAIQSDGKAVVGGWFTSYNGTSIPYVARLHSDGSLDLSFAPTGTGLNGQVRALAIQADGKVMVGGQFISYNGASRPYVVRLNSDGSLDSSFAPTGTGLNNLLYALAIQSDGKVVVAGELTNYNGASRPYVARLHSDGSLDTSFAQTGTGLNGQVRALAIQVDGKVMVGGQFNAYNGTSRPYVARLHSDGSLDTSFSTTGTGLNNLVYTLAIQSDGKVALGGGFTSFNGTSRAYLARVNTDGSLDTSLTQTGTGLNNWLLTLAIHNGKIVVGGSFTAYGNDTANYLARFTYIGTLD